MPQCWASVAGSFHERRGALSDNSVKHRLVLVVFSGNLLCRLARCRGERRWTGMDGWRCGNVVMRGRACVCWRARTMEVDGAGSFSLSLLDVHGLISFSAFFLDSACACRGPFPWVCVCVLVCLSVSVLNLYPSTHPSSSSLPIHANVWLCALGCGAVHPRYIAVLCLTALVLLYHFLTCPSSSSDPHSNCRYTQRVRPSPLS